MGRPENDFCIRVAGVDAPLIAVLRLRNIGLGAFRVADHGAVQSADQVKRRNRDEINREYQKPSQLNRLYNELQRATREHDVTKPRAPTRIDLANGAPSSIKWG